MAGQLRTAGTCCGESAVVCSLGSPELGHPVLLFTEELFRVFYRPLAVVFLPPSDL